MQGKENSRKGLKTRIRKNLQEMEFARNGISKEQEVEFAGMDFARNACAYYSLNGLCSVYHRSSFGSIWLAIPHM